MSHEVFVLEYTKGVVNEKVDIVQTSSVDT